MKKDSGHNLTQALSPLDLATLLYILCSAAYICFGAADFATMLPHLTIRALLCVLVLGMAALSGRFYDNRQLLFMRNLYPLLFLGFFYTETSCMKNFIFSSNLDNYVMAAEQSLWRCQPSTEFARHFSGEWFNELMNMCYFSYYLMISITCIVLFAGRSKCPQKEIFTIVFSFYMYYAIFAVFPVVGPQYHIMDIDPQPVKLHFFGNTMHWLINGYEQPTGAFPSSHVGIALIITCVLYRHHKKLFALTLPFALGICFATVYIRAHYLLDVIAGIISVPLFIILSEKVYKKFLSYSTRRKAEDNPELSLTDKSL